MKVLYCHNYYRTSAPSGENTVAVNELKLLRRNGIDVIVYEKYNDDIDESSFLKRLSLGINYAWSKTTYDEVKKLIKITNPDIAHIHSLHPQISPSIYSACQNMGVPVVHTLHNYRYICPGALLQRNEKPCEECIGGWPFRALQYKCYKDSLLATGSIFFMICFNRLTNNIKKHVNRFIVLTQFAASRFIAGGFPSERIEVKQNYLPTAPIIMKERSKYAVYVGRLSKEKGIKTLLYAWQNIRNIPLKIIGDGPLRENLENIVRERSLNVHFMGSLKNEDVIKVIGNSLFQIVPSECYEGFPMVILEAYACATPVIASRIGSLAEIVQDKETGFLFTTGSHQDLEKKINIFIKNQEYARKMGNNARKVFNEKYTASQNFAMLMNIYQKVLSDCKEKKENIKK